MAGLLASLSPFAVASEPVEAAVIRIAAGGATTRDDHEAVAKLYEDAATELQVKLAEKKSYRNTTRIKAIFMAGVRRICNRTPMH